MSFTQAVRSVLTQYISFDGRARRSEYWYFVLFQVIVNAVLTGLANVTGLGIFNILMTVFSLAVFLPSLGVGIRRYHDIGKSGWWMLFMLIPVIGTIICLVLLCKDSEPGSNAYGPNPKGL